jgi:DNA-binding response OmpR family regulator
MAQLVLLVAYEEPVLEFVRTVLLDESYLVALASTGAAALQHVAHTHPDIVILDDRLPDTDGLRVCRNLRTWATVPLLMLSPSGDDQAIVNPLTSGADNYLAWPCSAAVLAARICALLRRSSLQYRLGIIELRNFRIDRATSQLWSRDRVVALTPTELRLLLALAGRPGLPVDAATLMRDVKGPGVSRSQAQEVVKVLDEFRD